MRIIELDAKNWKDILDFHNDLLMALGAPEWHGKSVNALIDSMIWSGINAIDPPYTIRIANTATLPECIWEELELTIAVLTEARAEYRKRNGDDVVVEFDLPNAPQRLTSAQIRAVETRIRGYEEFPALSLRYGFFRDFKGSDTILFFGSAPDLSVLTDALRQLPNMRLMKLWGHSNFIPLGNAGVVLELSASAHAEIIRDKPEGHFRWRIPLDRVQDIISKIDMLIESPTPCHQYFDTQYGKVQVMVSKDEYPDSLAKEAC